MVRESVFWADHQRDMNDEVYAATFEEHQDVGGFSENPPSMVEQLKYLLRENRYLRANLGRPMSDEERQRMLDEIAALANGPPTLMWTVFWQTDDDHGAEQFTEIGALVEYLLVKLRQPQPLTRLEIEEMPT